MEFKLLLKDPRLLMWLFIKNLRVHQNYNYYEKIKERMLNDLLTNMNDKVFKNQ